MIFILCSFVYANWFSELGNCISKVDGTNYLYNPPKYVDVYLPINSYCSWKDSLYGE